MTVVIGERTSRLPEIVFALCGSSIETEGEEEEKKNRRKQVICFESNVGEANERHGARLAVYNFIGSLRKKNQFNKTKTTDMNSKVAQIFLFLSRTLLRAYTVPS